MGIDSSSGGCRGVGTIIPKTTMGALVRVRLDQSSSCLRTPTFLPVTGFTKLYFIQRRLVNRRAMSCAPATPRPLATAHDSARPVVSSGSSALGGSSSPVT